MHNNFNISYSNYVCIMCVAYLHVWNYLGFISYLFEVFFYWKFDKLLFQRLKKSAPNNLSSQKRLKVCLAESLDTKPVKVVVNLYY